MGSLKTINKMRRRVMGALTKNIGDTEIIPLSEKSSIRTILISRPNHRLGNLLLITPLIQELEQLFPNSKIDIFIKGGLGPIVLQEYKNVDKFLTLPKNHFKQLPLYLWTWIKLPFKKYDLVLNIDPHSSSGKISTKLSRATYKIYGIEKLPSTASSGRHMAKRPVQLVRNLYQINTSATNEIPTLNLQLTKSELFKGKNILQNLVQNKKPTISIFTYATGNKCYPKAWWLEFYHELKKNFQEYNIVEILPKENVSQIDFSETTYYSKDIREICSFIANTEIFIGADSGMMHLAVASKTPVIGLFSVTNPEKYEPYGENNFAIDTNKTTISENIKRIHSVLKPTFFSAEI